MLSLAKTKDAVSHVIANEIVEFLNIEEDVEKRLGIHGICQTRVEQALAARDAEIARLRLLLSYLQEAEAEYRKVHDCLGDGHRVTGRAWTMMKRAGARARAALQPAASEADHD